MADNPLGGMFAAPQRKPSTVQRIGNALAGFGAGVQGRGMEFIANQRAQEQALSQERTQAMIQDALAVDNLLANSQVEPAMNLMNQRLNLINELGGDPSDTAEVMQLVASGRVNEARGLIGDFLGQAESMGLFQRPKPEMINASQLTDSGQAIFLDPSGRVSARNAEGFTPVEERPTELARKVIQQIMPNGSFRTLQSDQRGNFYDMSGEMVQLSPDANIVEGTLMQGKPEDFNTTSAEYRQLRDKESATRAVIATVGDMISMLQENPNINTVVSGAASIANNLAAEARALGNALGVREEVDRLINPETFSSTFNELGIRNRQMQSLVSNLAYTVARSNDPGGRLSDTDVRRAIVEIGSSSSDPVAFARVLNDVARRAERGFQIDYRTRTGGDYSGGLGAEQIPQFTSDEQDAASSSSIPTPMTDEEFAALPSGTIFIDPGDGKQYRKE